MNKNKFPICGFVGWMENLTMKNLRIHLHFLILFVKTKGFYELIPRTKKIGYDVQKEKIYYFK